MFCFAVISNVTFLGKTYTNDNPLFVRSTCKRIVKITVDGIRANQSIARPVLFLRE